VDVLQILIAEDDIVSLRLLEATVRTWGYEPVCARDGREAWRILHSEDCPRLVILDWMMPHISGLDLCKRVRSRQIGEYVYILMLTAKGLKEDIVAGMQAGADDYMVKPFDTRELKARLRSARRIIELQDRIRAEGRSREDVQRRSAETLRRSRDQLQTVIDGIGDPIIVTDTNRRIVLANEAVRANLDGGDPVAEEMSCTDFVLKAFGSKVDESTCPLLEALDTGRASLATLETGSPDGPGGQCVLDVLASPIRNETGEVTMVVQSYRDITRYRETETALNASRAELEAIFSSAPIPIILVDEDMRVRRANESTEVVLDLHNQEVRPGQVIGCVHAHTGDGCGTHRECNVCATRRAVQRTLHEDAVIDGEEVVILCGRPGEEPLERTLLLHTRRLEMAGTGLVLICAQDITRRKHYEERIEADAEHLREVNEALQASQAEVNALNSSLEVKVEERTAQVNRLLEQKDTFINQMAHDLKTPLTPMVALIPMLRRGMDPERFDKTVTLLESNVQYMWNLVNRTLRLARIGSPSVEFEYEQVELVSEVRNILAGFETCFADEGIVVDNRIVKSTRVWTDTLYLRELFDNLISNAIRHMDEGGTLTLEACPSDEDVIVAVQDSGEGMLPEQCERVFNEFFKVDESRHDRSSAGLGLSICKRIVERQGGMIWAESDGPNQGTTFYFTLRKPGGQTAGSGGRAERPANSAN
jgi:signal transduction histidine kinase/DNA-binding response OmpR family regulator